MRRSWVPLVVSLLLVFAAGVHDVARGTSSGQDGGGSAVGIGAVVGPYSARQLAVVEVEAEPFGHPARLSSNSAAAPPICLPGIRLERPTCARVLAFLRRLALGAFFAALWAWDNPPSPGFVSWDCVGTSETGNTYGRHGPQYSSAFGMLNQAVRERADDPQSAARIMAGTATPGEERRAAWREDLAFGPGAWGVLTRAKCAI